MTSEGIVYMVRAKGTDHYKIGYTSQDVDKRVSSLQTGCPHELEAVATWPGTLDDESELHELLDGYRGIGEWFELTVADLVEFVREMVIMEGRNFSSQALMVSQNIITSHNEIEAARDLLDKLYSETNPLNEEALMYLERRGVSYETAVASGVRSWEQHDWARVAEADERLTHLIGLRDDKDTLQPYWCQEPSQTALVTPYRDARGRVVSVQLRPVKTIASKVKDWPLRKVSDVGAEAGAFVPSSVDLSSAPVVYVVEGTLDALSVLECGRAVVGAPGAGSWRDEWSRRHLSACELVIVFADADKAGEAFARRVARSVRSTCPGVEIKAFGSTRDGLDANDILSGDESSLADTLAKIEDNLQALDESA